MKPFLKKTMVSFGLLAALVIGLFSVPVQNGNTPVDLLQNFGANIGPVPVPGSGGGGSGDVVGPASATDNAYARYDGTTGKLLQNSQTTEDDNGFVTALAVQETQPWGVYRFFTDFDGTNLSANEWLSVANGAGSTINFADLTFATNDTPGIVRLRATNVAGYQLVVKTNIAGGAYNLGNGALVMTGRILIDDLNTGSDAVRVDFGVGDSFTDAEHTDAVIIRYDSNSTALQYGTRSAGSGTLATSTFTVTQDTWITVQVEVNAAGTSATFRARNDGDTNWTTLGTDATGIPTGTNRVTPMIGTTKTLGTNAYEIFSDYLHGTIKYSDFRY